jgi:proteasome lid subunit RPN8/RPN11
MGLVLDESARFKLERLCDSLHPNEVGGYLLGTQEIGVVVSDVCGIPNYSKTPGQQFQFGDSSHYYGDVAAKSVAKEVVGKFHSHPNGTIPSEGDMKACGGGIWLWVCHRAHGEHSFFAAEDFVNLEVTIQTSPQESHQPFLSMSRLNVGDLWINQWGKLDGNPKILRLLELDEKPRRAYLAFLQAPKDQNTKRASVYEIAKILNVSNRKARELLVICINRGLLKRGYGYRGRMDRVEAA